MTQALPSRPCREGAGVGGVQGVQGLGLSPLPLRRCGGSNAGNPVCLIHCQLPDINQSPALPHSRSTANINLERKDCATDPQPGMSSLSPGGGGFPGVAVGRSWCLSSSSFFFCFYYYRFNKLYSPFYLFSNKFFSFFSTHQLLGLFPSLCDAGIRRSIRLCGM